MERDPLPTDSQRQALCRLLHEAFIELRCIDCTPGGCKRAEDLAYAMHNIPVEIYGWGVWDVRQTRSALLKYQTQHPGGFDYVGAFDQIFPVI